MAIDTYRGDVPSDERTARLLDLLDRGLHQIQETVSALLVEARADRRALTQADLDDVRTLAEPRLTRSGVPLTWQVRFEAEASLPAAPVRQLLLNLVLNALDAAGAGGSAAVRVESAGGSLCLEVENTGRPLPPERRDHPFEPFPSPPGGRSGLGLWVCYQIVSQLHGTIEIRSHGDLTRVEVRTRNVPLAFCSTLLDLGVAGSGQEGREPVHVVDDLVGPLAGRDLAEPAHHGRHPPAALPIGVLLAAERSGTGIRLGVVVRAVVRGVEDEHALKNQRRQDRAQPARADQHHRTLDPVLAEDRSVRG